jgi:hypothetical protein
MCNLPVVTVRQRFLNRHNMDFATRLSEAIARAVDWPLGWLLELPRDVAIIGVAVLTSLVLTLVRRWTTDQDLLHRCRQDVARLKTLMRTARRADDKLAVQRMRKTVATVKMMQLQAEGYVLLASLLPVALLATWAVQRLEFLPPQAGKPLTVRAYYSLATIDRLTYLVPQPAIQLESTPIQVVQLDPADGENGTASWVLVPQPDGGASVLELIIRCDDQSARHVLRVGDRIYAPPVQTHAGGRILVTQTELTHARFLGLIPALACPGMRALGIPAFTLAPWLVAYLLLTIPLVPILRWLLRVS